MIVRIAKLTNVGGMADKSGRNGKKRLASEGEEGKKMGLMEIERRRNLYCLPNLVFAVLFSTSGSIVRPTT